VFIDDWDRNVAAASACGLIAIQFVDAAQLRRDLRALGLPLAAE
jgi:2-haloacid dehalogenase